MATTPERHSDDHREALLEALYQATCDDPRVLACWEQGSRAFERVDHYSDLDLHLLVEDGLDETIAQIAREALEQVATIELEYVLPQPTWHGHWQAYWRFEGLSPYLLADLVILERSAPEKFLTRQIHGQPRILFDHEDLIAPPPYDPQARDKDLLARVRELTLRTELFHIFVDKELARGRTLDALLFYRGFLLQPLLEAWRIIHAPSRHDFGMRYATEDLPQENVQLLQELSFVASPQQLADHKTRALSLLEQALREAEQSLHQRLTPADADSPPDPPQDTS